jgi:UPF0716 protein FxsA
VARGLVAAVLLLPVIELAVAVAVGRLIGAAATMLLILAGSVAGLLVLRRAGLAALRGVAGPWPTDRAAPPTGGSGLRPGPLVLAGLGLLFPGFVSDALGLAMLLPPVRRTAGALLAAALGARAAGSPPRLPGEPRVVSGEVVDVRVVETGDPGLAAGRSDGVPRPIEGAAAQPPDLEPPAGSGRPP